LIPSLARSLYVSYNYGQNWVEATSLLTNVTLYNEASLNYWPRGGVLSIQANADNTRLYVVGVNGRYWTTTNGVDFLAIQYREPYRGEETYFEWVEPNPVYPNTVVAIVATACLYHGNITCDTGRWDIIISNDGGVSWILYDTFVTIRMYNSREYWMYLTRDETTSLFVDKDTVWYLAFELKDLYGGPYGNQKAAWDVYRGASGQVSDAPRMYFGNSITSAVKSTPIKTRSNVGQASFDTAFFWVIEDFNVDVPGSRGTSRLDLFLSSDKGQTWQTAEIPPPPELSISPRSINSFITFFSFPEDRNFFFTIYTDYTTADGYDFNGDLYVNTGANPGQFTWSLPNLYRGLLYDVKSSPNVMIANHYSGRTGFGVETVISYNKGTYPSDFSCFRYPIAYVLVQVAHGSVFPPPFPTTILATVRLRSATCTCASAVTLFTPSPPLLDLSLPTVILASFWMRPRKAFSPPMTVAIPGSRLWESSMSRSRLRFSTSPSMDPSSSAFLGIPTPP
jgi:hypothetical protein